jgi:hypothetical protein
MELRQAYEREAAAGGNRGTKVRIPTKPATHSDSKEATYSDPKAAIIAI